jgi:basic membrane lipoprotein Med (substrate-binding protein (PBP1-ABC) superfamily)
LTPHSADDHGWNELAYTAVMDLRETLQIETSHVVRPTGEAFSDDIRDFAHRGYQLVVCHGGEYEQWLLPLGKEVPKLALVCSGGQKAGENLTALTYHLEEATYLAGIVAGKVTKTNRIAAIGGQNFETVRRTLEAFREGAKSVNPKVECSISYAGSWDDAELARGAAQAELVLGADVIFQNTDAASQGVFEAVAAKEGCFAFGSNADQNGDPKFTHIILGSAVIDVKAALTPLVEEALDGSFKGRVVAGSLENGIIDFRLNATTKEKLPDSTAELVAESKKKIIAGELTVLSP